MRLTGMSGLTEGLPCGKPSGSFHREPCDVSPDKNGAVIKTVIEEGEGSQSPWHGTRVRVHYTGWLENGEKFDSSYDRGEPFTFDLGEGVVIRGWDVAVMTMRKGQLCRLTVQPSFAYGEAGFEPKIPRNATLVFEIRLLSWEVIEHDLLGNGGVAMRITAAGQGINRPNEDADLTVHVKGKLNGEVFEDRVVHFTMGEGAEVGLVQGVEEAVKKLRKFAKAELVLQPGYAFGEAGNRDLGVPSNAVVEYEVHLLDFEKAKEIYEMTFRERIVKAEELKNRALKYFQKNDYRKALHFYERIILVVNISQLDSDYKNSQHVRIPARLNSALCCIKMKDFFKAKNMCSAVIEDDWSNVKAHYRLGEAYMGLDEPYEALVCFEKCIELEPSNTAAKKQLHAAKEALSNFKKKEKLLFSHLFDKLAENESSSAKR